jgi:hypothetical protein
MSSMPIFDPPGFLIDFDNDQRAAWSDWISQQIDDAIAGQPHLFDFDAPRPHFFNALKTPPSADAVEKDITWTAFPRIVQLDSGTDEERWKTADASRDMQDEYCEWSVARLGDGRIKQVTFTCEGPEYWDFLGSTKLDVALALYRQNVDPAVAAAADLVGTDGTYNPRNKWNNSTVRGAMHLIQVNNSLSAEIELAAGSSNTRIKNGTLLTDPRQLILCGRYGQEERHSDPSIGAAVNALTRAKADVTLANPVGIYFAGRELLEDYARNCREARASDLRGARRSVFRRRRHQDQRQQYPLRCPDCRLHYHEAHRARDTDRAEQPSAAQRVQAEGDGNDGSSLSTRRRLDHQVAQGDVALNGSDCCEA